ncbi:GNAT family N-acetyltransferase [Arthrobacter psychrolactophilus]
MTTSAPTLTLLPLKNLPEPKLDNLRGGIARLELAAGQDAFVGDPTEMVQLALNDPARHPFAIVVSAAADAAVAGSRHGSEDRVVGMGVLHVGAATDTGWPDANAAVLLRGFLVDRREQGRGYGGAATRAAVELSKELVAELELPATGVVLGVNERNTAAHAAYLKAGFVDSGRYLGGRSGPQHIMHCPF